MDYGCDKNVYWMIINDKFGENTLELMKLECGIDIKDIISKWWITSIILIVTDKNDGKISWLMIWEIIL